MNMLFTLRFLLKGSFRDSYSARNQRYNEAGVNYNSNFQMNSTRRCTPLCNLDVLEYVHYAHILL